MITTPHSAAKSAVLGALALATCCGASRAQTISYQFTRAAGMPGAPLLATESAGVGPATHWNVNTSAATSGSFGDSSGQSSASLVDSAGAKTTLTGTYSASPNSGFVYLYPSSSPTPNQKLYSAIVGANQPVTGSATLNLANIPYASYDLVVYLQGNYDARNNNCQGIALAGGPSYTGLTFKQQDGLASPPVFTPITASNQTGNYVRFTGLSGSSRQFSVTNSSWTYGTGISGYQVIATNSQPDIDLTGFTKTFEDEFNTLSLSTSSPKGASTWFYWPPYGAAGGYSNSSWNASSFSVSGGILTDSAWWNTSSGSWQSGNLSSMDSTKAGFAQQYGYFEARMKMPNAGTGAWPAFWLLGTPSIPSNNGKCLELDVVEWYGSNPTTAQQATHNWNGDGTQSGGFYSPTTPIPGGGSGAAAYHIYGVKVDSVHITWYIDGVQTNQTATPTAYMTPMYIMVDYALGGGWPLSGAPFPTHGTSSLQVDWVRVYSLP